MGLAGWELGVVVKIFLAIVSCWKHRNTHDAARQTWLQGCSVDHAFIMGEDGRVSSKHSMDELVLSVPDTYEALTEKALATIRYIYDAGYDFMLHVGRDTYVNVPRVLAAGLEQFDYAGNCGCQGYQAFCPLRPFDSERPFHYASGGAGSWLSRRAMKLILDSEIRHWADDLMFGWILGVNGIPLWSDWRFQKKGDGLHSEHQFTLHLGRGTGNYDPAWMYRAHEISR